MNGQKKVDDVNNRVCNLGGSQPSTTAKKKTTDDSTDHLAEGLTRPNKIMLGPPSGHGQGFN